ADLVPEESQAAILPFVKVAIQLHVVLKDVAARGDSSRQLVRDGVPTKIDVCGSVDERVFVGLEALKHDLPNLPHLASYLEAVVVHLHPGNVVGSSVLDDADLGLVRAGSALNGQHGAGEVETGADSGGHEADFQRLEAGSEGLQAGPLDQGLLLGGQLLGN